MYVSASPSALCVVCGFLEKEIFETEAIPIGNSNCIHCFSSTRMNLGYSTAFGIHGMGVYNVIYYTIYYFSFLLLLYIFSRRNGVFLLHPNSRSRWYITLEIEGGGEVEEPAG